MHTSAWSCAIQKAGKKGKAKDIWRKPPWNAQDQTNNGNYVKRGLNTNFNE